MVAYNFQTQFADKVAAWEKRQTIRRPRVGTSRHARVGDRVQLYTGMRTPSCRKLIDPDPVCVKSTYCAVRENGVTLGTGSWGLDDFAQLDGFDDWPDMREWFAKTYGLPFVGQLIRWSPADG